MAILYVSSEAVELGALAERLTGLRKLKWPIDYAWEGIWEGRRLMLAANGAGPKLAEKAVEVAIRAVTAGNLSSSRLEAIVSTGFCGALDPDLREGQVIVANEVLDLESQEKFAATSVCGGETTPSGLIVSQDRIANSAAEKQQLRATGAIAIEMEAAAVAARAKRAGLPFACIKVVTDRADESFGFDVNQMRSTDGRIRRGKIGFYALTHPNVVPELFRLKRRTQDAVRVLGEFLVNCRISSESTGSQPD